MLSKKSTIEGEGEISRDIFGSCVFAILIILLSTFNVETSLPLPKTNLSLPFSNTTKSGSRTPHSSGREFSRRYMRSSCHV